MIPGKKFVHGGVLSVLVAWMLFLSGGISARASADFANDDSFGQGGLVAGNVGPLDLSATIAPRILARDDHGRVIVGAASGGRWVVSRFLANGQADTTFGDHGSVFVTNWAGSTRIIGANLTSGAIRPDGKILLVGYVGSVPVNGIRQGIAVMVMKQLLPDGAPDPTFGRKDGGTSWSDRSGGAAVAVRPDGRFLVGAFKQLSATGRTDDGALFGFLPNGRRDPSFASFTREGSINILGAPGKPSYALDVEILRSGKILVCGAVRGRVLLMKLNKDGSYDRSFGKGGRVVSLPQERKALVAAARDIEVDRKGRIVATGFVDPRNSAQAGYGLILRFRKDGQRDRSFGKNGTVRLNATSPDGGGATRLYDAAIDRTGAIWVTGSAGQAERGDRHAIIARYLPSGKKDPRFFKNGVLHIRLGDASVGSATLVGEKKIYVSGRFDQGGQEHYFLRRFRPL